MPRLQAIAASIRKRFYDNFAARSNTTGSLGTATDGSLWDAVNGTIQVTSGAAVPTSTPSAGSAGTAYPMATVNMPTSNNVIKIGGANDGSAAAVWVQSGSDWWMVDVEADQTINANYSYAYQYAYQYQYAWSPTTSYYYVSTAGAFFSTYTNTGFGYASTSYGMNVYTSASYKTGYKVTTNYTSSRYANTSWSTYGYNTGSPAMAYSQAVTSYSSYSAAGSFAYTYTMTGTSSYTFISSYTTIKNEYLKIRKSVSNVVSVVTSQLISTSQSIASFLVSLSGNVITAKAYSDTNFVTQIGSDLVYTATGATITTKYGISLAPSTNYQSTTIGTSVDITRG